jgi:hypothetical protein
MRNKDFGPKYRLPHLVPYRYNTLLNVTVARAKIKTPGHEITTSVGRRHSLAAVVGKVTLKSNDDKALSNDFLLKTNGDEALNDVFSIKSNGNESFNAKKKL